MKERTRPYSQVMLEGVFSAGWIGLEQVVVEDPREWMSRLRIISPATVAQAFDARIVAGSQHLEMLAKQAWEAKRRGQLYADRFEVDFLMRLACQRQIKDALARAGLKKGVQDTGIIAFGRSEELSTFFHNLSTGQNRRDTVLALTRDKECFLKEVHRLPAEALSHGNAGYLLPRFLAERAALLQVKT